MELFRRAILDVVRHWIGVDVGLFSYVSADEAFRFEVRPSGDATAPAKAGSIWLNATGEERQDSDAFVVEWLLDGADPSSNVGHGFGVNGPRLIDGDKDFHGAALRQWRDLHRLTQEDLAEKLGTTVNTVARWERGDMRIAQPEMLKLALQQIETSVSPAVGDVRDPWLVANETSFRANLTQALRAGDRIRMLLFLEDAVAAARARVDEGDPLAATGIVARLAWASATGVALGDEDLLQRSVAALLRVYDHPKLYSGAFTGGTPGAVGLWLAIVERVIAVGALAVRLRAWWAIRPLVLQRGSSEGFTHWTGWLRHGLTMAARAGLFRESRDGRVLETSLVSRAARVCQAEACLRSDSPTLDEVAASCSQFDLLANVVVILDAGRATDADFYPSFATHPAERAEPMVEQMLTDPILRAILLGDDSALADALVAIDELARQEGRRFGRWRGFRSETVIDFIARHSTAT